MKTIVVIVGVLTLLQISVIAATRTAGGQSRQKGVKCAVLAESNVAGRWTSYECSSVHRQCPYQGVVSITGSGLPGVLIPGCIGYYLCITCERIKTSNAFTACMETKECSVCFDAGGVCNWPVPCATDGATNRKVLTTREDL